MRSVFEIPFSDYRGEVLYEYHHDCCTCPPLEYSGDSSARAGCEGYGGLTGLIRGPDKR